MPELNDRVVLKLAREALIEKLRAEGITSQLENVQFGENIYDPRYPNISGELIVDAKERFPDGSRVWTSKLKRIYTDGNGRTFAKTNFSLYELLDFNPTEIPEDFKYAYENIS